MPYFTSSANGPSAVQLSRIPAKSVEKRAIPDDVATVGYATTNGGTTGGSGGASVTVSTLAALTTAVAGSSKKVVIVAGTIAGNAVVQIGSNTTIIGRSNTTLIGIGLRVSEQSNVIIRNLKISGVLAQTGDAISIQYSNNIWLDHLDLSNDWDHDKDYYDNLIGIRHGSEAITVSYCKLHDSLKAFLCGSSDADTQDVVMTVTFAFNVFTVLNNRAPTFRFGTAHIFSNYYLSNNSCIELRAGAQALIENNAFVSCGMPIFCSGGSAIIRGNIGATTQGCGTIPVLMPTYSYTPTPASNVSSLMNVAGNTLSF